MGEKAILHGGRKFERRTAVCSGSVLRINLFIQVGPFFLRRTVGVFQYGFALLNRIWCCFSNRHILSRDKDGILDDL